MTLFPGFRARRALLAMSVLSVVALFAVATPAQGSTYGKALNATKKFSSQACARTSGCTSFAWQCGQPRLRNTQVPCKAYGYLNDGETCLIGLTWGVYRNKIYLLKAGKANCYTPAAARSRI